MLRTYRTCNSKVWFSKYEFYNKLLGDVTLLRVTPSVTSYVIYIYIYWLNSKFDVIGVINYQYVHFFLAYISG